MNIWEILKKNFKVNDPREADFNAWYEDWAKATGQQGSHPDDPRHHYDYRKAKALGAKPERIIEDGQYHWPSDFKTEGHPRMYLKGRNTKTGEKL